MSLSILPTIYLVLVLIIPIASLLATSNVENFWSLATEPVALSAYLVTFSMALVASLINGIFGFLLAWVLVRYDFPGKKTLDAAIDLPFALPTSVAGLTLATIYSPEGWIGQLISRPKNSSLPHTTEVQDFFDCLSPQLTLTEGSTEGSLSSKMTGSGQIEDFLSTKNPMSLPLVSGKVGSDQSLSPLATATTDFCLHDLRSCVALPSVTPTATGYEPLSSHSYVQALTEGHNVSEYNIIEVSCSFIFKHLHDSLDFIANLISQAPIQFVQTRTGVALAMIFVSFPFVVRNLQPVLQEMDTELEEIAWSLGANSWITFRKIILPPLLPTWIAGITLSFSRAIGEYGSVVVMASNIPLKDLIASVLVFQKLEQYETLGATVIGTVVLLISLFLLFAVQILKNYFLQNQK